MRSFGSVVALGFASYAIAQGTGTIKGKVLDENGVALANANVRVVRVVAGGSPRLVPREDLADVRGEFQIALPWGSYILCPSKEADGYADTIADLYASTPRPIVTLSAASPAPYVVLRTGPRAGVLKIQSITDAATGRAISTASVTVTRRDTGAFMGTNGKSEFFIPALIDVSVKITAPGYIDWFYPGVDNERNANWIRLKPGEHLSAIVALGPKIER
ncbi:MAG TPA: carboxypeptidase-like regulatory domain-containing protein [Bryobacteraceae bacterium]|nr:carboxypeptidase-like regulatory domain-containing protein [Bryobacteraceae bacterium]